MFVGMSAMNVFAGSRDFTYVNVQGPFFGSASGTTSNIEVDDYGWFGYRVVTFDTAAKYEVIYSNHSVYSNIKGSVSKNSEKTDSRQLLYGDSKVKIKVYSVKWPGAASGYIWNE